MKTYKKILCAILVVVMCFTSVPLNILESFGFSFSSNAALFNEESLPEQMPEYPAKGQTYWIIFNEGLRSNRLEMSTFNVTGSVENIRIVWSNSLKAVCDSGSISSSNQFHYEESEWVYDRNYPILSDSATRIFASNVDVYDKYNKLICKASDDYNAIQQRGDKIIQFGSYPQSKVTDSATISALNSKAPAWSNWTSYGYYSGTGDYGTMVQGDWMRYTDVTYNGNKYRGVKFTQYRPYRTYYNSSHLLRYQEENGYSTNTVYWFKFESINWRILDPSIGLVMCETIIDSQPYSNTIYSNDGGTYGYFNDSSYTNYASDYETSSIRKWLNNDFYNTAFTDYQKKEIHTTTLNNDGYYTSVGTTGYEVFDGNLTNDKIFLLSYNEARNSSYGFDSNSSTHDIARQAYGSDYAQCHGLEVYDTGSSVWHLRSPGNHSKGGCWVASNGWCGNHYAVPSIEGVRPALCLSSISGDINYDELKENEFIEKHLDFIKGTENNFYSLATDDFRFAHTLWENMDSVIQIAGEFVHDIIEGTLEVLTLQGFDGLKSIENPYDALLLDFLASDITQDFYNNNVKDDAVSVAIQIINDLIKMLDSDASWAEGFDIKDELDGLLNCSDYKDNKLYKALDKLLKGKGKSELNAVFQGFECFGKVLDNLGDYLSLVDFFVEMLRYIVAIEAYYNSSEIYKSVLRSIAYEMYSVNSHYAQKFYEAFKSYDSCVNYESIMNSVVEKGVDKGFSLIQDLTCDVLSSATYTIIMKAFGVGSTVAGKINAALWAADVGFGLSNALTGNDTAVNCRRLMRANYMFDIAAFNVMKDYESTLKSSEDYVAAQFFDNAFIIYKNIQLYSLETYKTYCESSSTKLLNFYKAKFKNELEETVGRIREWNKIMCHYDTVETLKVATVVVACPTDIYVYRKSDNKLVATVINNVSKSYSNEVSIICIGDEKALACDKIDDYRVEIVATDNGTMDVTYNSYSDGKNVSNLFFDDVTIKKDVHYELDYEKETIEQKKKETIQFGSYPQSKVTDSKTISALNSKAPTWSKWKSYGYYTGTGSTGTMKQGDWMKYTDVTYNGVKYRGVKFIQYRPYLTYNESSAENSYQDANGYNPNTVYWFKFEPINWIVLDADKGYVVTENIIDAQAYSNTIYKKASGTYGYFNSSSYTDYASDYETSSIRKWLNDDFYNTAFTESEKTKIGTTTLKTISYYTQIGTAGYEKLDSNQTKDKVFLLSYSNIKNSKYGFSSNVSDCDAARQTQGSDYAKSQGLYVNNSSESDYKGNSHWMLRTAGSNSYNFCRVSYNGSSGESFYNVYRNSVGIRPALLLKDITSVGKEDEKTDKESNKENTSSSTKTCYCRCHKTGLIARIIWKFKLVFNRIFGSNKVCSCGVKHY